MNNIHTWEIDEKVIGIPGLGKLKVISESSPRKFLITGEKINDIEYLGNMAKKLTKEMTMVNDEIDVMQIKQIASDAVRIPYFRIHEKSRRQEVVFAQYLVYYYVIKYFKFTQKSAGIIFDKNHATALHGYAIICPKSMEDKYLKTYQREWRQRFFNKLNELKLLNPLGK